MIEKLPVFKDFPAEKEQSKLVKWLKQEVYAPIARRINWLLNFFTATDDGEGGEFAPGFGPVSYIDFDIEYMDGQKEGRLQWNSEDGTLEVGLPGGSVNLQIGQETLVRATNTSGGTLINGTPVYINGANGANVTIDAADADFATGVGLRTIGVATEDILDNQKGYVTIIGLVREIDTSMFAAAGTPVYLAVGGGFATAPPIQPDISYILGVVVRKHATEGVILVLQTSLPNLNSLSDVYVTSQHDLALLMWNTATNRYEDDSLPWRDENFDAISLGGGASAPDRIDWRGGTIETRGFNGTNIVEQLFWGSEVQHDYVAGSDIIVHVHWAPVNGNTGDVKWLVDYTVEEDGLVKSGTLSAVAATPGIAWQEQRTNVGTIDGTGMTFGDQIGFRLYRDPSDAEDTYGSDAAISFTVGFHYQVNKIGSRSL